MRELLDFFVRNSKWFVFILLVMISSILLFTGNPYQHHVYLTSANGLASGVYKVAYGVSSYFNLRSINDDLNERNAMLEEEVMILRNRIQEIDDMHFADTVIHTESGQYEFIVAHVINNSISKPYNFITINKGYADGIRPEMGVIDQNGVVGSVNVVAEHSARVISVLNSNFHVSCKLKGTNYFGSLSWPGGNPRVAILEDLPRHSQVQPGDTILTTGFSAVFPPDIPVGVVLNPGKGKKLSTSAIKVRLLTDFSTLSTVQVVVNSLRKEIADIEQTDNPDKERKNDKETSENKENKDKKENKDSKDKKDNKDSKDKKTKKDNKKSGADKTKESDKPAKSKKSDKNEAPPQQAVIPEPSPSATTEE